jgi:D-sedoheptulose 7-phosphate isomerase
VPEARTHRRALFAARIQESIDAKAAVLRDEDLLAGVEAAAALVADALRAGGKLLLFGNGGSAADATHIAAELVGRFKEERVGLPALSLTDNVSSVSAIANDYAYDEVFARQVEAFGRDGDVAIALTTSGLSKNVVRGLQAAVDRGLRTVAFTGATGGDCLAIAEHCLRIPSADTARIQECTLLLCHAICEWVEREVCA